MNKELSRHLDLLRVVAALLVLFAHVSDPAFTDGWIRAPSQIGYSSVMIFFVISGYVISYVAAEREFTLLDFAISRVARVYSVVVPAIALTVLVDVSIINVAPTFHAKALMAQIPLYQYAKFPKYLVLALFFGDNLSGFGIRETLFSNGAYWSMCFEVYYYILFAIFFYVRGLTRGILLVAVVLVIGPGPLAHFPLWLFGCAVYQLHRRCRGISMPIARILFVITCAMLIVDLATDMNLRIDAQLNLLTAGWFGHHVPRRLVGDTLTGALVAVNIFAARYLAISFGVFGNVVAYLASFTFSLYLMHIPLLRFWSGYFHLGIAGTLAATLVSAWLLGQITEKQKTRIRNTLRRLCVTSRGLPTRAAADWKEAPSPGRSASDCGNNRPV